MLHKSPSFFSPQNAMYFIILHILVQKLFTYYTKYTLQLSVQLYQRGKYLQHLRNKHLSSPCKPFVMSEFLAFHC